MADQQLNQSPSLGNRPAGGKAIVIGLYGIPGSGKTFLLNQLKKELDQEQFALYEGSEVIANIVPGGLEAFQELDEQDKVYWRELAINTIGNRCKNSGSIAVVTGHFMFWPEEEENWQLANTQRDLDTFTHILYLDVPAETVVQRHLDDVERSRPPTTAAHLQKWQQTEESELRRLCRNHGILFSLLHSHPTLLNQVLALLHDFRLHTEEYNLAQAESMLDKTLARYQGQLGTCLFMDADRTLAAEDSGALFWKTVSNCQQWNEEEYPLKSLFSGPLGYSYTAFRQATLMYEEVADDQEYEALCQHVASAVAMHSEFVSLLRMVAQNEHIGAVIVSCGLRRVWEKVVEREGLSTTVKVIAGGRIADGFVVTATVKAALISRLQDVHQLYVWAFGDSPLDLAMLKRADRAVVVVSDERTRSKTMDAVLSNAIDQEGLQALQLVLPHNASHRLNTSKLPLVSLTGIEFICSIFRRHDRFVGVQIFHATDRDAAKLLATPMRDAANAGPALRAAHRRVGWYLASEFLTHIIGVEECQISHVLGHHTIGYRLCHEQQTTILALMRAGDPMASGINDVFPLAMYVHARHPDDVKLHHLQGQTQVLLVDSVVNSGKTVMEFMQAIRNIDADIRIVVVAGVVQAQCVSRNSVFYNTLSGHRNVCLVTLRLSETKFTGSGTTDTGNRLFNTTHLL